MKDLTPKKIKAELNNFIAHLHQHLRIQLSEFKHGRTSTYVVPRSGRPIEAATSEIINKIHDIVLTDQRWSESARAC